MKRKPPNFTLKNATLLVLGVFLFLVGCANQKATKQAQAGKAESLNTSIVNKYWKLISLNGHSVTMAANQEREIYFTLKTEDNRVTGFSGCNTFNGTYTLRKPGKIAFSQMLSTMMACPDVAINESEFLNVFAKATSYKVVGDTLWLGAGATKQTAMFAAIYFH